MAVLNTGTPAAGADVRTGLDVGSIKQDFRDNLFYVLARFPDVADRSDLYQALCYTVRDRMLERWVRSAQGFRRTGARTVCYLSAEFLLGPQLGSNLLALGIEDEVRRALQELGLDLDELVEHEVEPGLGNGGLGRLAACFMDSLASLRVPAIGYGIRYEFGIFTQDIRGGWQVERADRWLSHGHPWEVRRPGITFDVMLGGRVEHWVDDLGRYRARWLPEQEIRGVAYDTPIIGHGVDSANLLRLWAAEAVDSFDFAAFNSGDYIGAVEEKIRSEIISKVLYPNDEPSGGKALRLAQQYFLVSCSLRDMVRIHLQVAGRSVREIDDKYAVQLNDTHPALAVVEFMRLLLDEHLLDWDTAWALVTRMCAYTNHTLLPEALESWPLPLFGQLLPRHLELVYEINHRFLAEARLRFPSDDARIGRLSIIDEHGEKRVRMANLACVACHSVNGVARLHTELLERSVLADFHALWPRKFRNVTNGVSPRRFVALANRGLSALVTEAIGDGWIANMGALRALEGLLDDTEFLARWRAVKRGNKLRLADRLRAASGVTLDPDWMFDVQAKRIHEYKRQHLNILHVVSRYLRLKRGAAEGEVPTVYLFGGKAAPGYFMARLIIKLINSVAEVVNRDSDVNAFLRVAFLPNFNVKEAHVLYPAADVSEQISLAGKEASGTGNMKFAMNGALTIGTLDGANVEIREAVGAENFFLFGLDADAAHALRSDGYCPRTWYEGNEVLREALDLVANGYFSDGDRSLFRPLVDALLERDEFLVLADFAVYLDCQGAVARGWADRDGWTRRSMLNVARIGRFSSDRAIREYCEGIWDVAPPSGW